MSGENSCRAHLTHHLYPVVGDRDAQGHLVQANGAGLGHDAAVAEQAEDATSCETCPTDGTNGDEGRLVQPQKEVLQRAVGALSLASLLQACHRRQAEPAWA